MLGHDLLQHISDGRSLPAADVVRLTTSLRAIRMLANLLPLDCEQANLDSLPQLRWYFSQTGIMCRQQTV